MSRRFYNRLPQGEGIFPNGSRERTIYEDIYNLDHVGTPHHSDHSEENSESEASSFPNNILGRDTTNDIAQVGAFTVTQSGREIKYQSQVTLRSNTPIANPIDLNTSEATYLEHELDQEDATYSDHELDQVLDQELDQEPDHLAHNSLRPSSSMQKPFNRMFGCFRRLWVRDNELEIT